MDIETIHNSLVNGQKKQMVSQIDEYGLYEFWADYKNYVTSLYDLLPAWQAFTDATISYFRIKNR